MRITTYQSYENAKSYINKAQTDMNSAYSAISSGKRVLDPVELAQSELTQVHLSRTAQNIRNQGWLDASLTQQENSLNSSINALLRLKELSVQSNNASLSPQEQSSIAVESAQLWEHTKDSLNLQDASGNYLFGGYSGATQPFDASGNYVAQGYSRHIEVSPGVSMKWSLDGSDFTTTSLSQLKTHLDAYSTGSEPNLNQAQPQIDAMVNELNLARTKIGVTMSASDAWLETNKTRQDTAQNNYSKLTDVDMAQAITDFKRAQSTYEATLKMTALMEQNNLFKYM